MKRSPISLALTVCITAASAALPPTFAQTQALANGSWVGTTHDSVGSAVKWVGSWATAEQIPEPYNALPPASLTNSTLREIVHLSIGGSELRVRLSNEFGTQPLHLTSVHIAHALSASSAKIDPATDRALTFNGSPEVTIPAGAEYISDPVGLDAPPLSNLAVSIYFTAPPAGETGHPGSRSTTYIAQGNQTASPDLPQATTIDHWYSLSGIDVAAAPSAYSIIAFGDSITDGHASTTNGNDRWPDDLAARLESTPGMNNIGVVNEGIGGNHMLTDGLGPNTLARFDRDVLAQPGSRYVILLEGINDLGKLARETPPATPAEHAALVHDLISSFQQFIERAHARGLIVIGGTIMPDDTSNYYHPGPIDDADREAVNTWIRTPGHFDAVIDFEKAMADPSDPGRLNPAYDSGDHLHPSPAGYHAMANAIPLSLFAH